jgi:hypothetical protein
MTCDGTTMSVRASTLLEFDELHPIALAPNRFGRYVLASTWLGMDYEDASDWANRDDD